MEEKPKTIDLPILLPQMGESVSEATVIDWLKQPGDNIEQDELFVTIGTDKVDSDLPSSYEGILKEIIVQEGSVAKVGSPICILKVDAHTINHNNIPEDSEDKEDEVLIPKSRIKSFEKSKTFLSPVVRKIATEAGLELKDLVKIKPSGQNGRISKKDVINYLQPKKQSSDFNSFTFAKSKLNIDKGDKVNTLSRMQTLLSNHLQSSFLEIPHVTTFAEVDVTDIVEHRETIKGQFLKTHATKLTYTHYFQYAIIQALVEFPLLNAWMNVDELIIKSDINLGFATSLKNGDLMVPNVKAAQSLNFLTWVKKVNKIAAQAKNGQLKNDDVLHTTFTVSNTGMFGSMAGTPIISKPQVGVLALGQIISAPGVIIQNGIEQLAIRKKMMLSISYDHRVINGAYASQFLTKLKEILSQYKQWDFF